MRSAIPILALCVACAATEQPPVERGFLAGSEPSRLAVVVEDHLAYPYELEQLVVALDGSLLYRSMTPNGPVIEIAELTGLPAGDHVLAVLADVSYASGSFDDRCLATVRKSTSFRLTRPTSSIRIHLGQGDVTYPFAERLRVDPRFVGYGAESATGCE